MTEEISPAGIIMVALILLAQSVFLFLHARKHNHNYWLWGIVGLIQAPMPLLFYLIFVRKIFRENKKNNA
jgi:hypothetical protein